MRFQVSIDTSQIHPVIKLSDTKANCSAEIYAFGALLNRFEIQMSDGRFNCVDGFSSVDDAIAQIENGYKSAFLSPFVCRMNNGKHHFDGVDYKVEKSYLQEHAIHGIIFDAVFKVVSTHADEHFASVELHHHYGGTDAGYPFEYDVRQFWKLQENNKLTCHTMVEHVNEKAIPYSNGWHPYFTLGTSVDECTLEFDSDTLIEFDATLLPTGNKIKDERFINGTKLQDIGLDNCFELNKAPGVCVLKNNQLQLKIESDASYPFIQIYTPPHRKTIAIENLSAAPDAFNNKMGLLLLQPHKQYHFTTNYSLHKM
jgi:aldose 1-epimerase